MRKLRLILGALLATGAMAIAGVTAFAQTSGQTTQLNVTVPASISMTGLATHYDLTIPAGSSGTAKTFFQVSTNDFRGYTLTIDSQTATFDNGAGSSFPVAADSMSLLTCPTGYGAANCLGSAPLSVSPTLILKGNAAATDNLEVDHTITVPASAPSGTFHVNVDYLATGN